MGIKNSDVNWPLFYFALQKFYVYDDDKAFIYSFINDKQQSLRNIIRQANILILIMICDQTRAFFV